MIDPLWKIDLKKSFMTGVYTVSKRSLETHQYSSEFDLQTGVD